MKTKLVQLFRAATLMALAAPLTLAAANNQILGWNNLGMHCMDSDYSVFTATASASKSIVMGAPIQLGILDQPVGAAILWPRSSADAVLERTAGLDPPRFWMADTNSVLTNPLSLEVDVPTADASAFFRLRQVQ